MGSPGCSDDAAASADGAAPDAMVDAKAADASTRRDGAPNDVTLDATPDAGALPSSCQGSCSDQTLSATFGATSAPLERAIYGLEAGDAGKPLLYIEALHGGFSGCPLQDSPTPLRTLVIAGLPLPRAGDPLTLADGLTVSLLDFEGDLLGSKPLEKASAATARFVAADVCAACLGQPAPADPDGFVALDLDATFPSGTIGGRVYATHCDSLDR